MRGQIFSGFFLPLHNGAYTHHSKTVNAKNVIINLRKQNFSIIEIQEQLAKKNIILSLQTINAILEREGFAKLYRRTKAERLFILNSQRNKSEKSSVMARAVNTTETDSQLADSAVEMSMSVNQNLGEIISSVENMNTLVIEVSNAMNEQTTASNTILTQVESIKNQTDSVDKNMREQTLAINDISKTMKNLNDFSERIKNATIEQITSAKQINNSISTVAQISELNKNKTESMKKEINILDNNVDKLNKTVAVFQI